MRKKSNFSKKTFKASQLSLDEISQNNKIRPNCAKQAICYFVV